MITKDISVRPAKGQVLIQGSEILAYHPESGVSSQAHAVHRTQSYVLRSSAPTTVVLPGEYLELDLPPIIDPDCTLAIEARTIQQMCQSFTTLTSAPNCGSRC